MMTQQQGRIDLHTHSNVSDGAMTPAEVVRHAKEKGLAAIALTDHDSMDGVPEAMAVGRAMGVEVVPGIEFSVQSDTETHILGYYVDYEHPGIREMIGRQLAMRDERMEETEQLLQGLGFDVTLEEARALAPGGIVGRAHFARVMVNKGLIGSVKEAFDRYLGTGRPAFSGRQALTAREAIHLIRDAGGLSFVAHPQKIELPDAELVVFLRELKAEGLCGLEGYYSEYTPEMTEKFQRMARELGLEISGGTDFHGSMKPHIEIGSGMGNLCIPYTVLARIKELRGCPA